MFYFKKSRDETEYFVQEQKANYIILSSLLGRPFNSWSNRSGFYSMIELSIKVLLRRILSNLLHKLKVIGHKKSGNGLYKYDSVCK